MLKMNFKRQDRVVALDVYGMSEVNNMLMVVNAVGSRSQAEAVAAMVRSKSAFECWDAAKVDICWNDYFRNCESFGYWTWLHHLGMDSWQLLAITRNPEFIRQSEEEHVWQHLRSDKFTTPILRSWMPYVMYELKRRNRFLIPAKGFGLRDYGGLVKIDDTGLDRIVWIGLETRNITIPEEEQIA